MKVLKIIWNVIRYIIGGILVLFGLVSLFSDPLPGVFLILSGLTTMPFLYSILRKTKMVKGLITALAIILPIAFFIAFTVVVATDPETVARTKIETNIKKATSNYFKPSKIEASKEENDDKYIVSIDDKLSKDDNYDVAGCYAIDFINLEKGLSETDKVDDQIELFKFELYIGKNARYGIEYTNSETTVEQVTIKDYKTRENIIYTAENCEDYKAQAEEIKKQKEAAEKEKEAAKKSDAEAKKKAAEEEEAIKRAEAEAKVKAEAEAKAAEEAKQAEENRKKDTSVVHNVGETVKCPYFDVTLNSFQVKKEGTYIDSYFYIADPEWVGVILTVYNTSTDTHTFYSSNVTLQNSTGEIITHKFWNYDIWGAEMLNSPKLISGGTKTGYISYANTNQDDSNLILVVSCNDGFLSKGTEYKFSLK